MDEQKSQVKAKRDRSPSYPSVALDYAIDRLVAFDEYFKRHPAPFTKVGLAWGISGSGSQSSSIAAALKSFGLVDYQGSGKDLKLVLTEDGRTYLRAQQEDIKQGILRLAALKPKAIEKYWNLWGAERPPNPVSLDELVLNGKFSQVGAENFLKVYDTTIDYAGLSEAGKITNKEPLQGNLNSVIDVGDYVQWESGDVLQFNEPKRVRAIQTHDDVEWVFVDGSETGIRMSEVTVEKKGIPTGSSVPPVSPPVLREQATKGSEHEWLRGPLSKAKGISYRLIVSADLGPKEIEKLIKLLQTQKDILSDDEEESGEET